MASRKPTTVFDRGRGNGVQTAAVTIVNDGARNIQTDGLLHVHDSECGDLRKYGRADRWDLEAASLSEVVEDTYRYGGSFYAEAGFEDDDPTAWRHFAGEFRIFPCVVLPDEPTYAPKGE